MLSICKNINYALCAQTKSVLERIPDTLRVQIRPRIRILIKQLPVLTVQIIHKCLFCFSQKLKLLLIYVVLNKFCCLRINVAVIEFVNKYVITSLLLICC